MPAQDLVQLFRRYKTPHRWQQRPARVYPVLLKSGIHLFPEMAGTGVMVATGDNGRVVRQVIEQSGCALEKQWEIVFTTSGAAPCADLDIGVAQVRVHLESVVPVHLKAADGAPVQRVFARRQEIYCLHLFHRALGLRVEGAQCVHLGIQQVDAVGQLTAHGKDIEQ